MNGFRQSDDGKERSAVGATRRQIIRCSLAASAGCLLGGCSGQAQSQSNPSGDPAGSAPDMAHGPIEAGPLSGYLREGIYESYADQGFFLVRRKSRLFAVSSVCTHQHVLLDAGRNDFGCPRHGSVFSIDGVVLKAPARSSLPHHPIRLNEQGHLIIDTSVNLAKADWGKPGSFLAV